MTNMAFELAFRDKGIPFFRADVGDRNVLRAMKERGWQLGGEPSGHILNLNLATLEMRSLQLQVIEIIVRARFILAQISGGNG